MSVYPRRAARAADIMTHTGARHKGAKVDCPMCRGPWAGAAAAAAGTSRAARSAEGYLNLSSAAGLSPVRDTSSCECCVVMACRILLIGFQTIMAHVGDSGITVTSTMINGFVAPGLGIKYSSVLAI